MADTTGVGRVSRALLFELKKRTELHIDTISEKNVGTGIKARTRLLSDLITAQGDWMLVPRLAMLPSRVKRNAALVHDLRSLDESEGNGLLFRERKALKKLDTVFTVSDFTAERVTHHFPAARVVSLDMGAMDITSNRTPTKTLLYVAANRPHKRVNDLTRAWSVSGLHKHGWTLRIITNAPRSSAEGIVHLSALTNGQMEMEFRKCGGYVHVSNYEGLGLPILQAIASGIPTISTALPTLSRSLSEDSQLLPEATVGEIAQKMVDLTNAIELDGGKRYSSPNPTGAGTNWDATITNLISGLQ
ncbi:glycosyltransferase [Rhodococcus sp. 1168]|uniref:glycosyltransferase n=1 Tax=Rhodococcus sp. 1168 TaxID=2018041 RepID=UPI000F738330|nr:glycosyltransferase [Rhodococcus sp. 1168]